MEVKGQSRQNPPTSWDSGRGSLHGFHPYIVLANHHSTHTHTHTHRQRERERERQEKGLLAEKDEIQQEYKEKAEMKSGNKIEKIKRKWKFKVKRIYHPSKKKAELRLKIVYSD